MTDARFVETAAIKTASQGKETDIFQKLRIPWPNAQQHIRCPSPNHTDEHPSWRWDQDSARAFCTCADMSGADLFTVVMTLNGEDFEAAKLSVATLIGRADLIRVKGAGGGAENLLNPPSDKRDDELAQAYLGVRLDIDVADVVMPTTGVVAWSALAYYDPPASNGGTPILVGEWPCAVFETVRADGKRHAHRIYVERSGAGKAKLGMGRSAKKSATGKGSAGCAVVWGDPNAHHVVLCEGIETGAAIAFSLKEKIATGGTAVAAAISDSGVKAFQPWPGTRRVTVAADRDEDKAPTDSGYRRGEQAAHQFGEKHNGAIGIDVALPGNPGEKVDWLDMLLRDDADAVVAGIMNAEKYQPKTEANQVDAEAADPVDLDTAKQQLADLAERAKDDAGAPFEPDTLGSLSVVRGADPAMFARLKADLKKAGVSMRDLNRELRKHSFRVIEGGAQGGDGATERAGPYKVINHVSPRETESVATAGRASKRRRSPSPFFQPRHEV